MRNRFRFRLRTIVRAIQQIAVGLRLTLSGKTMLNPNGQVAQLRGTNQGNWGENYDIDAGNIKRLGATVVRTVFRWQGPYDAGTDSYNSSSANSFIDPTNYAKFLQELDWLEAQGLWIVLAFDSDYGAGNRGVGNSDWNFFDTTDTAGKAQYTAEFFTAWRKIATDARNRKRILAYELLPEPLTSGADSSHDPILKQFYRDAMANVRTVDPTTPFLIGGRGSYALNTLSGVYMSDRTDVIYTVDLLTNKVEDEAGIAADIEALALFRDTNNVPVLVQQVGRNTSEDEGNGTTSENSGLTALNGALSLLNAYGIPFTHWQYHQNSTQLGNYSLWAKTNAGLNNSTNWTPKPDEIASFGFHMTQTYKSLEDAAIAAAIACGGELFYVKSDLSNVFQDSAGTTAVTTVGQSIGRINAVVGSRYFQQTTSGLRPTLATTVNGYTVSFLPASESWMSCDTTYFTISDTKQCAMVAARVPAAAANRNLLHCGTSGSVVRWPALLATATDEVQASWRGDDNTLQSTSTITTCDNRAIVATAYMDALDDKRAYLQGVQEGTTNTTAPGSVASLTRLRWGASTTGANGLGGPSPLLFICKTAVTAEQRRAISRFAAYLVGAPFRGAIPANTNVLSARMIGGQIATPVDWSADAMHTDIMKRTRSFALVNGTVPSGSVKYLESSGTLYVQSLTRASGVTSVVLSSEPTGGAQLYSGMRVVITCPADPTFDTETAVITVTDQTHFTYVNAGADKTYTAVNDYDIACSSVNQVQIGAAGHPIEDFYAVLSTVSGTATARDDLNGTYTITFPGSVPTSLSFAGCTNINYVNGATSGQISISGTQSVFTTIQFNGVATDGSFRVPTIVRTDHNVNNYARPDFVKFLSRFGFLRFMDGGKTNNNAFLKSWANRPLVASGLGMTIEQMVDLCNQVGCDMWYCFPVWATNDYIDGVCTLIKSRLRSDLNVYFEHSNEVWNSGAFAQWHWMLTKIRYETNALLKNIDNINQIQSISRSGTTVTVTLAAGVVMPYVTGQNVAVKLYDAGGEPTGDANTLSAAITVTGASTFTYQKSGTAGAVSFNRGAIYGNLASNLLNDLSITDARGPYDLIHRMHAKRTYEIAQRVKDIFDGVLNVRARVLLMGQMDDFDDGNFGQVRGYELPWLAATYPGPVNTYLWGVGGAAYAQANGSETTHAGIKTTMNAYMDAMEPMLQGGRYIASLYGLEYVLYEGGPDTTFFYASNPTLVTSFFGSTEMRDVSVYNLQKAFGFGGADKYCLFQTSFCDPGVDGDKTWGVARSLTDGGGQIGSVTAERLLGIDDVLLAGKPSVTNTNVLPGTIYFQGGSNVKDELGSTFNNNGMRHMYNAQSVLQAVFYAPAAGNVALTIWGKRVDVNDFVEIYIDGVKVGTHALFRDGTGVDAGTSGGYASPTTFTLPVGWAGWHVLKITPPATINDGIGISKVVGV